MNPEHILRYVINPVLSYLARDNTRIASRAAQVLLLGTGKHESDWRHLQQIRGPAIGLWQMEPATYRWNNEWLADNPGLQARVNSLRLQVALYQNSPEEEMRGNLLYACAMARIHYWTKTAPLPDWQDVDGLARYHEVYYNSVLGAIGKTPDVLEARDCFAEALDIVKHVEGL